MLNELASRGVGGQISWPFTCSFLGHEFNSHLGRSSEPKRSSLEKSNFSFYILSVTIEYVDAK